MHTQEHISKLKINHIKQLQNICLKSYSKYYVAVLYYITVTNRWIFQEFPCHLQVHISPGS